MIVALVGMTIAIAVFFAILIPITLLRGLILTYLWAWFVVPLGVAAIGLAQAIGVSIIVSFLTFQGAKNVGKGEKGKGLEKLGEQVGVLLFAWGIGYVVHSFM